MAHHLMNVGTSDFESTFRAEDGIQRNRRFEALYEGIIIPCGFVAAVLLALLIVIFRNR